MLAVRLQRVGIEEPVSCQVYARKGTVIERLLKNVKILPLTVQREEPVIEEDVSDRGTGLAVC